MEHPKEAHLLNFVYKRSRDEKYTQTGARELRRYNAPILSEIKSNNKSFERSIIFQGAKLWNVQGVDIREVNTLKEFKKIQKTKLNALLPYV